MRTIKLLLGQDRCGPVAVLEAFVDEAAEDARSTILQGYLAREWVFEYARVHRLDKAG